MDVKSGRSGAHKPDRLGLSCKVKKCSDAGTGNLGVLGTHETSPCFGDAGSTCPGCMSRQVQVSMHTYLAVMQSSNFTKLNVRWFQMAILRFRENLIWASFGVVGEDTRIQNKSRIPPEKVMFARWGSRVGAGPWLRSFETRKTNKRPVSKNKKNAIHWHLSQRMSHHKQLGLGTL